jgi:hypothetical protein
VDCDVHEALRSPVELLPYLAEPYGSWLRAGGFNPPFYSYFHAIPMLRADAAPADGPPGSSYELLRDQLLDRYGGALYAILTSHFHPTAFRCQLDAANALASAYNDYLVEEWLARDDRLCGSIAVNGRDPAAAAREIDRVGQHPRLVQVMLSVAGIRWGEPQYDPIFAAAERKECASGCTSSASLPAPLSATPTTRPTCTSSRGRRTWASLPR